MSNTSSAFHDKRYTSIKHAWECGLNEHFWRWGLVFNQGNEMNVTEHRVKDRLRVVASRLLRKIYGNRYRDKAKVRFLAFRHGVAESFNEHYHALMAIEGEPHEWSDDKIALAQLGNP